MDTYDPWRRIFRCTCGAIVWARWREPEGVQHATWQVRHGDGEALRTWTAPEVAAAWDKTPAPRSSWLWPNLLSDWIDDVHEYERGTPFVRADFIVSPPG